MIKIVNVSKDYKVKAGLFRALSGINLELPNTGFVSLYGENGCGKTTLLNLISTLDTDYQGEILYNGKDIRTIASFYRRDIISSVLQENYFVDYLDVSDNIRIFSEDYDDETINEELSRYKVEEKKNENPQLLSGGQKQRVSLVRSIIKKFKIILVDEPTSSMNEEMEQEVFKRLKEISKDRLVILVSHNISLIRQYSDLVIMMDNAEIRSVEKNSSDPIEYRDGSVLIPRSFAALSAFDTGRIKDEIDKNGSVTVKYAPERGEAAPLDYSIIPDGQPSPRKRLPRKTRNRILLRSTKKSLSPLLLGCVAIVFLSLILSFVASFAFFDPYDFLYSSLTANYDGLIRFRSRWIVSDDPFFQHTKYFNRSSYNFLRDTLKSDCILQKKLQEPLYTVESHGEYSNLVSAVFYCSKDNIELLAGEFASSGAVMISDYLADGIIAASDDYSNYSDLISKGIPVNGITMRVSGIVRSGYDKYKSVINDENFRKSDIYGDFSEDRDSLYESVYCPCPEKSDSESTVIIPMFAESVFVSVYSVSKTEGVDNLQKNECIVNRTLAGMLSDNPEDIGDGQTLKTPDSELTVREVTDDGSPDMILYVHDTVLKSLAGYPFSGDVDLLIRLKSVRELKELENHNMNHDTSISKELYSTVIIVNKLTDSFALITVVLLVLTAFCCLAVFNRIRKNDSRLAAFLRICEYSGRELFILLFGKAMVLASASVLISLLLYCTGAPALNSALSSAMESTIRIFSISPLSVTLLISCIILGTGAAALINYTYIRKKDIIDLIR